jgi:predicted O-methyltransferase YrrM
MSQELWTAVERYLNEHLLPADPVLEAVRRASHEAGLPAIEVSPGQGKLLQLIARVHGSRNILEIGTLAGYSTIWFARALPAGGRIVTLELDPNHAEVARANFARAGVAERIELRLGPALETLPQLEREKRGPFDLVFIDADKEHNAEYFTWALKLSRPGAVIVVDNVVRRGNVIEKGSTDGSVQGARRLMELLANEPRVDATALQTVGKKGYDGFLVAVVNE